MNVVVVVVVACCVIPIDDGFPDVSNVYLCAVVKYRRVTDMSIRDEFAMEGGLADLFSKEFVKVSH